MEKEDEEIKFIEETIKMLMVHFKQNNKMHYWGSFLFNIMADTIFTAVEKNDIGLHEMTNKFYKDFNEFIIRYDYINERK